MISKNINNAIKKMKLFVLKCEKKSCYNVKYVKSLIYFVIRQYDTHIFMDKSVFISINIRSFRFSFFKKVLHFFSP